MSEDPGARFSISTSEHSQREQHFQKLNHTLRASNASESGTPPEAPAPPRRGVSIRFRLASLVATCVLPVWIAAGFLVYHTYQSRRALTEQHMLDTARALKMVVDRQTANIEASLTDLASSSALDSDDLKAFYGRAKVFAEAHPGTDIILSDANGRELINTFRPFGAPLPNRGSIEVVRKVYETGRPSVANVYRGASTDRLRISVDVPVFRKGQVVYDLAMAMPPDDFNTVLSQQHLPPEWLGRIFDANQVIVARTRSGDEYFGRQAGPTIRKGISSGGAEGTTESVTFEGIPMFNSFSRSETSGWSVVIGVPKAVMLAGIWRWLGWTIGTTALLSIAGIVLALLMARRISRSIQALIAPALALGRGEPVTIGTMVLPELADVGASLVRASELIQQRAIERERAAAARRETEDLRRLNAELERSEARAHARATELAAIMDAAPAFTYIAHDPECDRMTISRAAYDLHGPCPDGNGSLSVTGNERSTECRFLRNGVELSTEELPVQVAAATGHEVRDVEYTVELADGSSRSFFGNAVPLFDELGKVRGAVGAFIDISERKREEEKRHVLEQQLRQSQKMEAVGRLAGGIAHDFNNLLMVIQSYTEMLQDSLPEDDIRRKQTLQILKASERAAGLTGRMLAFSRKQITSPVVFDLNAVIHETAKMLERLIGEDIDFQVVLADSLWAIEADPDQIVQVLMNLCVNSRDAMPRGGTLTIATENVIVEDECAGRKSCVSPGEYVKLTITDTGVGMSKEIHERIFEPFFTTKEVGKGSGLGLAMVYGIVKQSGGHVWVDSELEKGTCFTIYLPATTQAGTAAPHAGVAASESGTGVLLVVEDEEALREAICDHLKGLGYAVLQAGSGQEALSIANQAGHIDLLVTDIVMPKMSGRELAETLGKRRPNLKIVFMSGYTNDEALRNGIHELGENFLHKPFKLGTLANKLREMLRPAESESVS